MLTTRTPTSFASKRFRALGTEVLVYSPAAGLLEGEVERLVEHYEARFSRFRVDSELSQLSALAGRDVTVSAELFEVLSMALTYWRETAGVFDPLILTELETAGYDRTFSAVPRSREDMPCLGRSFRPVFGSVALDEADRRVRLPAGARLDLGGIAKGWIVDQLSSVLSPHGSYLIDVGGDMAARGAGTDGGPGWLIAIADPLRLEQDVCWLRLLDEAIATSTTMRRRWNRGGRWLHHIIDPRTGAPAASDLVQATVLAPTAAAADVFAKTALILGSEAGLHWLTEHALPALLVTDRGEVVRSPGWERSEAPMTRE
jgi:thiamine biosynthesis lipoprotein